jgi:hypothetical protein
MFSSKPTDRETGKTSRGVYSGPRYGWVPRVAVFIRIAQTPNSGQPTTDPEPDVVWTGGTPTSTREQGEDPIPASAAVRRLQGLSVAAEVGEWFPLELLNKVRAKLATEPIVEGGSGDAEWTQVELCDALDPRDGSESAAVVDLPLLETIDHVLVQVLLELDLLAPKVAASGRLWIRLD